MTIPAGYSFFTWANQIVGEFGNAIVEYQSAYTYWQNPSDAIKAVVSPQGIQKIQDEMRFRFQAAIDLASTRLTDLRRDADTVNPAAITPP